MIGWSAFMTFLYRIYIAFEKFVGFGESIVSAKADLELIKTNHLPHLQAEVAKVNENLSGLREDLKDNFSRMSDDLHVVLTRMK
jgi:hypothetical protein